MSIDRSIHAAAELSNHIYDHILAPDVSKYRCVGNIYPGDFNPPGPGELYDDTLRAGIYRSSEDGSISVCFRGSNNQANWQSNVSFLAGNIPDKYKNFAVKVCDKVKNYEQITFVGHSAGGVMATVAALYSGNRCIGFDVPDFNFPPDIPQQSRSGITLVQAGSLFSGSNFDGKSSIKVINLPFEGNPISAHFMPNILKLVKKGKLSSEPSDHFHRLTRNFACGIEDSDNKLALEDTRVQVNKLVEHFEIEAKKQAFAHTIMNAEQMYGQIKELGDRYNSKALIRIGTVGGSITELHKNFSILARQDFPTLTGQTSLLGSFTSISSFLNPYVCVFSAGMTLLSVFGVGRRRKKGNDGLGKALQAISKSIQTLHKEMRESFQQVFKNQEKIYNAVIRLANFIEQDFRIVVLDKLDRIETTLNKLLLFLAAQAHANQRQILKEILDEIEDYEIKANFKLHLNKLKRFLKDNCIDANANGANLYNQDLSLARISRCIIGSEGDDISSLLGYFAKYVEEIDKDGLANFNIGNKGVKLDIRQLPNMAFWEAGVNSLIDLTESQQSDNNNEDIFVPIRRQAHNMLLFVNYIRTSKTLFSNLFDEYHKAIEAIQKLIYEGLTEKKSLEGPLTVEQLFPKDTGSRVNLDKELDRIDRCYNLINMFYYLAYGDLPWNNDLAVKLLRSEELLNKKVNFFTKSNNQFRNFSDARGWEYTSWTKSHYPLAIPGNKTSHEIMISGGHGVNLYYDHTQSCIGPGWYNNSSHWNHGSEWYNTCQSVLISIDGKTYILCGMRYTGTSEGYRIYLVDPITKSNTQKATLFDGSHWYTISGKKDDKYNTTIKLHTLKINNRDIVFATIRNQNFYEIQIYDPATNKWERSEDGPAWSDAKGYGQAHCYETIRTNILYIKGQAKLYVMICNGEQYELYYYDHNAANGRKWQSKKFLEGWLSSKGYNQKEVYDTIRTEVIHVNGNPYLLAMIKNNEYFEVHCYDPENDTWLEWPKGPAWDKNYNQVHYYRTLRTGIIEVGEGAEKREVLLAMIKNKNYYEMHCFDPATKTWQELPHGPAWSDTAENGIYTKDVYYEYLRLVISKEDPNKFYLLMRKPDGLYCYEYQINPLLVNDLICKEAFLEQLETLKSLNSIPRLSCGPIEETVDSVLVRIPGNKSNEFSDGHWSYCAQNRASSNPSASATKSSSSAPSTPFWKLPTEKPITPNDFKEDFDHLKKYYTFDVELISGLKANTQPEIKIKAVSKNADRENRQISIDLKSLKNSLKKWLKSAQIVDNKLELCSDSRSLCIIASSGTLQLVHGLLCDLASEAEVKEQDSGESVQYQCVLF